MPKLNKNLLLYLIGYMPCLIVGNFHFVWEMTYGLKLPALPPTNVLGTEREVSWLECKNLVKSVSSQNETLTLNKTSQSSYTKNPGGICKRSSSSYIWCIQPQNKNSLTKGVTLSGWVIWWVEESWKTNCSSYDLWGVQWWRSQNNFVNNENNNYYHTVVSNLESKVDIKVVRVTKNCFV